jgi:hypothetical protein
MPSEKDPDDNPLSSSYGHTDGTPLEECTRENANLWIEGTSEEPGSCEREEAFECSDAKVCEVGTELKECKVQKCRSKCSPWIP